MENLEGDSWRILELVRWKVLDLLERLVRES